MAQCHFNQKRDEETQANRAIKRSCSINTLSTLCWAVKKATKRLFLLHWAKPWSKGSSNFPSSLYAAAGWLLDRLFGRQEDHEKWHIYENIKYKGPISGPATTVTVAHGAPTHLGYLSAFSHARILQETRHYYNVRPGTCWQPAELTLRNLCAVWGHLTFVSLTLLYGRNVYPATIFR